MGAACGVILMVSLFALAFWEIGKAVMIFAGRASGSDPRLAPESQAMIVALKGIEYLFLAPICLLVYRSLAIYVVDKMKSRCDTKSKAEVAETKYLVTSLMAAVVATDLIGRVLTPDGLTGFAAAYELALLLVLAAYMFLLHHFATCARGDSSWRRGSPPDGS